MTAGFRFLFLFSTFFSLFGSPFFFFKKVLHGPENGMKTAYDKALAECRHTSLRNLACFCPFWLFFLLLHSLAGFGNWSFFF